MSLRTRAQVLLESGDDPTAILQEARSALERAVAVNPDIAYAHIESAAVELIGARFAIDHHRPADPFLAAAATAVRKGLDINPASSSAWQTSAEVHRLKAAALRAAGATPRSEIVRGLADARKALELNPASWQAMITAAGLHQLESPPKTRSACELLDRAVRTNPLAEHDAAPYLTLCTDHD